MRSKKEIIATIIAAIKTNDQTFQSIEQEYIDQFPDDYLEIALEALWKKPLPQSPRQSPLYNHNNATNTQAVTTNPFAFVNKKFILENPGLYFLITLEAVKQMGSALQYVDKEYIKNNPELYKQIVQEAVKEDTHSLRFIAKEFIRQKPRDYTEIVAQVVRVDGLLLQYVSMKNLGEAAEEAYQNIVLDATNQESLAFIFIENEYAITHPNNYYEIAKRAIMRDA